MRGRKKQTQCLFSGPSIFPKPGVISVFIIEKAERVIAEVQTVKNKQFQPNKSQKRKEIMFVILFLNK